jgi:Rrf2 family protein
MHRVGISPLDMRNGNSYNYMRNAGTVYRALRTAGRDPRKSLSLRVISMLSQTAEHAIRAILYLAQQPDGVRVPADSIARALEAPANYMAKTLNILAKHGILGSARGASGGFWLEPSARDLSLGAVVRVFDGPQRQVCILGGQPCNGDSPCSLHFKWREIVADAAAMERTTIGEFVGVDSLRVGGSRNHPPSLARDPPVNGTGTDGTQPQDVEIIHVTG